MKDLPALFRAFIMPYLAVYFGSCIGFMFVTSQEIPMILWGLFLGALGEMGIHWSLVNLRRK